jgi:hypothetical protein
VGTPRVWPHPSWSHWPPPLHNRLMAGLGPLLGWFRAQNVWVSGPLLLSFVQLCIALCLIAPFDIFSIVLRYKSCKTLISKYMWNFLLIVKAYVYKFSNFSSFCVLIGGWI